MKNPMTARMRKTKKAILARPAAVPGEQALQARRLIYPNFYLPSIPLLMELRCRNVLLLNGTPAGSPGKAPLGPVSTGETSLCWSR